MRRIPGGGTCELEIEGRARGRNIGQHTGDADDVAGEQTRGVEGDEDSVSHFASDCDGSETDGENHGDCHCIDRAVMSVSWRIAR